MCLRVSLAPAQQIGDQFSREAVENQLTPLTNKQALP